jgi:RNA polymerase sigma-70 factor, ECF subfamily
VPREDRLNSTIEDDPGALSRASAGDREAFDAFMERHAAPVLRFIRLHQPDLAQAEDALQETFVAAWRGAGDFRGGGSARPWLLAIARRAVLRQGRRRVGEPDEAVELDGLAEEAGWGADRDGHLHALELRDLVEQGFRVLSPEDREILLLRDVEGFSGEEVGQLLGLSLPAAKSRLHRARLRFMTRIRELDHEG